MPFAAHPCRRASTDNNEQSSDDFEQTSDREKSPSINKELGDRAGMVTPLCQFGVLLTEQGFLALLSEAAQREA